MKTDETRMQRDFRRVGEFAARNKTPTRKDALAGRELLLMLWGELPGQPERGILTVAEAQQLRQVSATPPKRNPKS